MYPFKIYTAENAPPPSDDMLNTIGGMLGFIPNVFAVIAESPSALKAFTQLNQLFADSNFDATSRELIQIAASIENQCAYCVAGHTAFSQMQNVPDDIIDAIRNDLPIANAKLEALNRFTRVLVHKRGSVSPDEVHQFLDAGYTPAQVIDVILGICVKTFSNLTNNVVGIPLDSEFSPHAWHAEDKHRTVG